MTKTLLGLLAGALALAGPLAATAADDTTHDSTMMADPHALTPADPNALTPADPHGASDPHAAASTAPGPTHVVVEPGAAPTEVNVQPENGATTVTVEPGAEARAGFAAPGQPTTRSPEQLRDQQRTTRDSRAPFMNSLIIAPRGMAQLDRIDRFNRTGESAGNLGLQLDHVLGGPLSVVIGGDVGQRDRGPGISDVTTFGLNGGVNLFVLGGHNEGLYVGPRVGFAAAGVDPAVDGAADRFGYGGEVGLRAIVGPGFTAGVAVGVMNQTRGTVNFDRTVALRSGGLGSRDNFGYGALQLGWSW